MTELEAAPTLIAQTGIDALRSQLLEGRLTADEYHAALPFVAPGAENGIQCAYCGAQAVVRDTCATHASLDAVIAVARARRPVVDSSRYPTRELLIPAIRDALESAGQHRLAVRWTLRAGHAPGMNALHQIAREFPIVLRSEL